MKRLIVKVGKSGKIVAGVLGLFIAVVTCWGIWKTYSTKNVTGKWKLKFTVEKCNHQVYIGDTHTQETVFIQNENTVTGRGEKWDYNGKPLPFDQHRKLEYTGTIEGDKLTAMYILHGRDHDSEGAILVSIDGKTISGTFSGTIGNDRGTVTGERID